MSNEALDAALAEYEAVGARYVAALEEKGLVFAEEGAGERRRAELRAQLAARGVAVRNAGASLSAGHLSPACVECTGNRGSETFSTTFKCHRDCYFCFNHNQPDYEKFFREGCPWEEGVDRAAAENGALACVGLTGGEPLLDLETALRFLGRAGELGPGANKRLYTSGDLLTVEAAARLRDAGLDEIRFSVKDDDAPEQQERVIAAMRLAKEFIPSVMVEMPVIPGARTHLQQLFRQFEDVGIDGINLLDLLPPSATGTSSPGAASRSRTRRSRSCTTTATRGPGRCGQRGAGARAHAVGARRGPGLRHALLLAGEQAPQRDAPEERARRACAPVRRVRRGRFLPEDGEGLRAGRGAGAPRSRRRAARTSWRMPRRARSRSRRATSRQCGASGAQTASRYSSKDASSCTRPARTAATSSTSPCARRRAWHRQPARRALRERPALAARAFPVTMFADRPPRCGPFVQGGGSSRPASKARPPG